MRSYYNEIDPYAAQWLRNLIAAGHISYGEVDTRSIVDVEPSDLSGFTQCHFFAGLGGWSYALRLAGWDDARPVWTGSPPCQPFSVAGRQKGKDDDRHLAPHWLELVSECRPATVFGEQVTGAIRHGWFDDLQTHMEGQGYACGMVVLPACGIGAPHIRQRQWIVAERLADTNNPRPQGRIGVPECSDQQPAGEGSVVDGVADTNSWQQPREPVFRGTERNGQNPGWAQSVGEPESCGEHDRPGQTNGHWRAADWLLCRDGKWRPVEPGTFPLAHGVSARVGRLRAYGNAIVAPLAAEFIKTYMDMEKIA